MRLRPWPSNSLLPPTADGRRWCLAKTDLLFRLKAQVGGGAGFGCWSALSGRRIQASLLFVLIICLGGCAPDHFSKGHGDVGQFILQQADVRGGLSISTNGLTPISDEWRYSTDDQGVVIQMAADKYPAIESLLRQTFGEPKFFGDTEDGGKLGGYRLTPKGGAIQFGYNAKRTQVIIIRPLTPKEFGDDLTKALQSPRFWKELTN